jgi:hypothetical protein
VADTTTETMTETTIEATTGTMTETEPVVQPADPSAVDGVDADALLNEAAASAAEVQQEGGDLPTAAEPTTEAATASTTDQNAPPAEANRIVKTAGGIGSGIEDLDALLAEVAQEPAPAGDEAQATAGSAAGREVAEEPAAGDAASQPTDAAAASQGSPQANEVAQTESDPAAGNVAAESDSPQNDAQIPLAEATEADDAAPADVQVRGPTSLTGRLVCGPLDIVAIALEILDAPFARLSTRTKAALGYIGIATLAVAAAVWFAGPAIMSH